jgi:hypothetical protein
MSNKPCGDALGDCGLTLGQLAEIAYTRLSDEDRAKVNALTREIDEGLLAKRGHPHGIGPQGLREIALFLVLRLMEPGKNMDQMLAAGVKQRGE